MRRGSTLKLRPDVERLESKQLLSAGMSFRAARANAPRGAGDPAAVGAMLTAAPNGAGALASQSVPTLAAAVSGLPGPGPGLTLYRITNPNRFNMHLIPPFQQVLVQNAQPIPGQVYNLLSISVRNGTARTFDANSGFFVRFAGQQQAFPILTGTQQWLPRQVFVFYILTKKYYPPSPPTSAGFEFNLGGSPGVAIPGPSGIFLRVKYNPATFARMLDFIVAHGPGSKGHQLGLPDTAIWEFLSSKTNLVPL